ncbi:MAG TPA: hypothetical protein VKB38_24930 [Terracidiphilus sp.]|nr:hypothetical protein [Terracidiphilus sp.]
MFKKSSVVIPVLALSAALIAAPGLRSQNLTLEGQTGGFITPTAYVVYSAKKQFFSYPAVGFHFVNASKVIGTVETFNIAEGFANRAELGYTREVHQTGNSPAFSELWHYAGMNIFNGKFVAIKDGQWTPFTPGLAAGFVVRTDDKFVTGALDQVLTGQLKSYSNHDLYAVLTKTWPHAPLPFLANFGWKATNASIFGIGGQATRFGGRLFGGLGFPIPVGFGIVAVPAAGFSQQPPTSKNLDAIMYPPGSRAHLPTTLDYAVRVTQRENPHFAFDIGVGQVAGMIGSTAVITPNGPVVVPVDLKARSVFGIGLSVRF